MSPGALHPALSGSVPALLTAALFVEVVNALSPADSRRNLPLQLSLLAFFFGVPTFITGYFAGPTAHNDFGVPLDPIALHHWVSRILLFSLFPLAAVASSLLRQKQTTFSVIVVFRTVLLFSWSVALYTGYLGGQLVFTHGAGVTRTAERNSVPEAQSKDIGIPK